VIIQKATFVDLAKVESTKYTLLRRLGFVFRHHLVGSMQPLNIMCQVMHLKLKSAPIDVAAMGESIDKTSGLVSRAINSSLDVIAWLSVDESSTVEIGSGVQDCIYHLESSLSFRGFEILHEKSNLNFKVNAAALREVLSAAVLAAADHAEGRSEIEIRILAITDTVEVTLQMHRGTNDSTAEMDAYRLIQWDEVERLAQSHGVGLQHALNEVVKIQLERCVVA